MDELANIGMWTPSRGFVYIVTTPSGIAHKHALSIYHANYFKKLLIIPRKI